MEKKVQFLRKCRGPIKKALWLRLFLFPLSFFIIILGYSTQQAESLVMTFKGFPPIFVEDVGYRSSGQMLHLPSSHHYMDYNI